MSDWEQAITAWESAIKEEKKKKEELRKKIEEEVGKYNKTFEPLGWPTIKTPWEGFSGSLAWDLSQSDAETKDERKLFEECKVALSGFENRSSKVNDEYLKAKFQSNDAKGKGAGASRSGGRK